jgi:hypothetical protein
LAVSAMYIGMVMVQIDLKSAKSCYSNYCCMKEVLTTGMVMQRADVVMSNGAYDVMGAVVYSGSACAMTVEKLKTSGIPELVLRDESKTEMSQRASGEYGN